MRMRGYTLVELMVTVALVAILASIAIPSYARYLARSRRSSAEQLMTAISNREAQYLLDARAYTASLDPTGLNMNGVDGWTCAAATCTNAFYTVAVTLGGTGFSISGTPSGSQASDGALTLTSTGARTRMVSGVDQGW